MAMKRVLGFALWGLAAVALLNAVVVVAQPAYGLGVGLLAAAIFLFVAYWLLYAGCWASDTWMPVNRIRSVWRRDG